MSDRKNISHPKQKNDFSQAVVSEKHERVARKSLHDMVVFNQAVEEEMQQMEHDKARGKNIDSELYERMAVVREKYKSAMTGFLQLKDNDQRHALITFADAIQDLMKYIHLRRVA